MHPDSSKDFGALQAIHILNLTADGMASKERSLDPDICTSTGNVSVEIKVNDFDII